MKNWIRNNINPPGLDKKDRGSLFSLIAGVFGIVKTDAEKAFNAFFPYLSDPGKLREHGKALSIPEFPSDTEAEYRERVSTASFYLMRAGERAYILDRLAGHFGTRFASREEFLHAIIEIVNADSEEMNWTRDFLDGILDPNILITISAKYGFVDMFPMRDQDTREVQYNVVEVFNNAVIRRNGRIFRDGKTILDTELDYLFRNGTVLRNGSVVRNGLCRKPAAGEINAPVYRYSGTQDFFSAAVKSSLADEWGPVEDVFTFDKIETAVKDDFPMRENRKISARLNYTDSFQISEMMPVHTGLAGTIDNFDMTDTVKAGIRFHYFRNGSYFMNGAINRKGGILFPLG
jgi:hypothetical protein